MIATQKWKRKASTERGSTFARSVQMDERGTEADSGSNYATRFQGNRRSFDKVERDRLET